ncbi:DUF2267 domain-containing protein [Kitasatospora sp. MAP5-34]|uniref:DUF2267 domain-containing protein n=1 Tax=Kitasatospora sp. MAP5-34 TaxID=3035102 RepID=UPI0024771418|nr:DUF2267 domain-containing protein [Kitasatospora sp. MAP5-34]MDH6580492.1 uncharacterized protein (DUF2267 family) [Kitasatospora sp. MAP5-34]
MHPLWDDFLARVVDRGKYTDQWEADHAVRVVLGLLGEHLVGAERTDLAQRLPKVYAPLMDAPPADGPISARRFVEAAAHWITGATPETAQWDVSAVLSTVADLAEPSLLQRILTQLPDGYDLLFGRPQPT